MIGPVQDEDGSAGDGAEFPDDQPVVVHGVVVKDVVVLKRAGIVAEIIVDGEVAHLDAGAGDHVFEVDGLRVAGPGIDARFIGEGHGWPRVRLRVHGSHESPAP